jgi:glutathione synthase/RimK-type ligase-like ATP-grasp enzyme
MITTTFIAGRLVYGALKSSSNHQGENTPKRNQLRGQIDGQSKPLRSTFIPGRKMLRPASRFGEMLEAGLMRRIALATSRNWPQLADDDQALLQPLAARGFAAEPALWDDSGYCWSDCSAIVIRSCWDYHLRSREFLGWAAGLEESGHRILNSAAVIRWNADKSYLRELEAKGISVVPSLWFEPGRGVRLKDQLARAGWGKAVIKPRISATAHRTVLIRAEEAENAQELFDDLRNGPGVMVQRFMASILSEGEWSLMFFRGEFSHAVLKTPKAGDFRVQEDYGGRTRVAAPPAFLLEQAAKAVRAVGPTLYARVDGVIDDGRFSIMELELIEPALFLKLSPGAAERFADAIIAAIAPGSA